MSTTTPVSKTDSSNPSSSQMVQEKTQSNPLTAQPQRMASSSPNLREEKDDEEKGASDGEKWETIGYEETEEGRKAKGMLFGHFQIKRKKKRLFSYHWNVRKY